MKLLYLALILAIGSLSGCSHFSKSARQQRAYAKYVRKSSYAHHKRQALFRQERAKNPHPEAFAPAEVRTTTEKSESPESVPIDSDNQ